MNKKTNTLRQKIAIGDADAYEYLMKITAECQTNEDKQQLSELASELLAQTNRTMEEMEYSIEEYTVKKQLGELADVINFSHIARKYFGKSKHWLYQRINGYTVNGKTTRFTPAEKERFNTALDDIKNRIGVFTAT